MHGVSVFCAPLSHCSLPSIRPLPQPVQSAGQFEKFSPLLHVPSPQYGPTTVWTVQLVVQVEHVFGGLLYAGVAHAVSVLPEPLSHSSPESIAPLPQPAQSWLQFVIVSPSPTSQTWLPHDGPITVRIVQLVVQFEHVFGGLLYAGVAHGASLLLLPSSHCSWLSGSILPLPQTSNLHSDEHGMPPFVVEPGGSQSSPGSTTPLPQPSCLQSCEQPSPSVMLPSSQASPGSTRPLPHGFVMHTGCTAAHVSGAGHTMPVEQTSELGSPAQPTSTSARMTSLFTI